MHFAKLDDSPMFRKQIQSLEESAELLRERSLKFFKGCRKYTEGLGEGYDGDIAFASSLETFGGGHNDPISVAFGGPVMTKFTIALREIGTYKEVLRSQVEHMLNDRLMQFANFDLLEVKEARKRFDKASLLYDQAREKFLSLRKGTKNDVASLLEEELHNARSSFEQARFNLVTALSNVEAKKRFEFLEAVSGTMDAHLRYFKQGYELLHQMEPYINQVLTYAQQSRERSNYEQAALSEQMQEYKRQVDRESRWSSNGSNGSPNGDGIQAIGRSSHKMIEEVMQSAAKGKVQTIRQGYLSKRSSNLRGDWKRRFFVLDSRGLLYYYRKQCSKSSASTGNLSGQRNSSELGSGLLSRWLSLHYHGGVHDEKSVAHHTVNLLTSTIKVDTDQSDLRFCFRIISPTKSYTLQAESALDQMDWIEKITGVIASLLSSQTPERFHSSSPMGSGHLRSTSESSSFESSDFDQTALEEYPSERILSSSHMERPSRNLLQQRSGMKVEKPIDVLRRVCGNDKCADCGAPEPDWASLNLGVLVCIECSGVHRNLGVHISKVRSLTLDFKVWEPSVISLFQSLGNTFANTVWEEMLQSRSAFQDLVTTGLYKSDKQHLHFISKPSHSDPISVKEKFIHAKYAEKAFVRKPKENHYPHLVAQQIWDSVRSNDKKAVYRLIINSEADVNAVYKQVPCGSLTLAKVILMQEPNGLVKIERMISVCSARAIQAPPSIHSLSPRNPVRITSDLLRIATNHSARCSDSDECRESRRTNYAGTRLEEIVDANSGKARLDSWISCRIDGISRARVQSSIRAGLVSINGRVIDKVSHNVKAGDMIDCTISELQPLRAEPEDIDLDIVYEDEHVLVVNKPPHMVVHPAPGNATGTLVNAILNHCSLPMVSTSNVELLSDMDISDDEFSPIETLSSRVSEAPIRPGIVHRLDKGTSGLLVVAKDEHSHAHLSAQFKQHSIERVYISLTCGVPPSIAGRIEVPICRDPNNRIRMSAVSRTNNNPHAKDAASRYKVIEILAQGGSSLVEWRLETGRTHQIRAHAKHMGIPLLGDEVYGGTKSMAMSLLRTRTSSSCHSQLMQLVSSFERPCLHALTLGFIHPHTGKNIRFSCPPPADFAEILGQLRQIGTKKVTKS